MFDPLIAWISRMWSAFKALFRWRLPAPEEGGPETFRKTRTAGRVLWRGGLLLFIILFLLWNASFIWGTIVWSNHTLRYPQQVLSTTNTVSAEEAVTPEGGTRDTRTCDRSQIVEMQAFLLRYLTEDNAWIASMPQFKLGLLGFIPWENTPFFDDKASFQLGALSAVRRVAVELTDLLGRERGTSSIDQDLQAARGRLQFDERTWIFNPFDDQRPFGPVQSTPGYYSGAIPLYERFNDRLERCEALFDARADNLFQLLDRIANDLGSTVDQLARRSTGERYDPRSDTFVPAEGNDYGWFDFKADNFFRRASGQMYAYHGLLQAARVDFSGVIQNRDLADVWDRMEQHIAEAAALDPLIVSNGREDGLLMPDHLSIMAENILRARANMTELRDILSR